MNKNKILFNFSIFHLFTIAGLIFFGALVKSHEAGLSVPDWPSTYGENMFLYPWEKWKHGKVFYEHGHRLLASFIGFLTIISTVLHYFYESRKWVFKLSLLSLSLVIVQGVFGGLTVRYQLPAYLSVVHGVIAQSFFILIALISYFHTSTFKESSFKSRNKYFYLALITFILLFCQLVLGAFMRHVEAGLAVPDFPTVANNYLPNLSHESIQEINQFRKNFHLPAVEKYQILLHLFHRYSGILLGLFIIFNLFKFYKTNFDRNIKILFMLIIVEIILGILILYSFREPIITSIHVLNGALVLMTSAILLFRTYNEKA